MGLRHVYSRALVTDIDDANSFCVEAHPDRHDMAAAKREYALDAALLQKARDQGGRAIGRDFHHTTPVLLKTSVRQTRASHATSSETVKTANTCEARIEPEVTPASSPYSFAIVNGPDPMGSALRITVECDHNGGIVKT